MVNRRVVVTGFGVISPLGHTADATWENIKAGKSGVGMITRFDAAPSAVKIAAEIKDWDAGVYMSPKDARRRDPNAQFGVAAAKMAVEHAGYSVPEDRRHRTGVFIGSAVGGIGSYWHEAIKLFETGDMRAVSPFGIPMVLVNAASDIVSIDIGAHGPSYTPISACATGADCIGHALDMIRLGKLDAAVAGGCEAPIIPIGIAAFDRIGACSRMNDTPEQAVRPFSKDRAGLAFAEGAGVLMLEALEHAQARGATIHAELVGYGASSDAFHITAPEPEGTGASIAIRMALESAGIDPDAIDYINAHGTATALNDVMETKAVKRVFAERAYRIPMSSTKSMTGHGMGATAGMEAVFCVQAIRDQIAPPTINLHEPDPECDLDYVPNVARQVPITYAMSNSFGFGGHNVSLIFRRFTD